MGADVDETNISVSRSVQHTKRLRAAISTKIKETFRVPDACLVHCDCKILQLGKSVTSDRCCVSYISGINFDADESSITTKLLGVFGGPK